MSKDMLGVAVRKLVTLPVEILGIVCDLLEKLSDPEWVVALKKFLRGELVERTVKNVDEKTAGLLKFINRIFLPAIQRFVASESFGSDNPDGIKFYLGVNFKKHFLGKIEENVEGTWIAVYQLGKKSRDPEIMVKLGVDSRIVKLSQFFALIKAQARGQKGSLLVNGFANIAYIEDNEGIVWAVNAYWSGNDWGVGASSVEDPFEWVEGYQVLSRK